ncbi:unnamed protein product [Anisakis simplex]|uniref:Transposase n=1 Tax=Anisakis simplex TaxID=6269 RepID=A0A0M3JII2_ANISI|nr:unnamed protein product [Anisakis simplex]
MGPSLTASGKPKFGYTQTPTMMLDGVLKTYQSGPQAQLHEVCT